MLSSTGGPGGNPIPGNPIGGKPIPGCPGGGAGSGIAGLAGMAPVTWRGSLRLVRPLLTMTKRELVTLCHDRHQAYVEDPSNLDPKFARVRMRRLLELLAGEGLDPADLARAIVAILDDESHASRLGRHGHALARSRYSADSMAAAHEALYRDLCGSRSCAQADG